MSVNHIYKVVWSKTKGCYIVVSELAKRVGRNKAKAIVISSAAMAMAVSPVMTSTVSATINQAGTGGNESVAFGEQSTAGGSGAVALGKTATASASGAVALGQETKAEKNNGVAIGKGAKSTEDSAIALGFGSKSSGNWSVAIGLQTNATNKQAVAVGSRSQASGENSIAIGNAANASNEFSVALGSSTTSTNKFTIAVGGKAFANQEGATALGYEARATAKNTIAIGNSAKAEQEGVLALGAQAYAKAADTIAIGNSATAKQTGDIIIGKEAKSRDQGGGRSVAIGFKATAGSNRNGHENDDASTEKRGDDGSVAIGTNAYTGLNKNNTAVNNSVALGAGAGVGYRSVGDDGTPLGVGTDADDNTTVLVKAFGGTTSKLDYFKKTGKAQSEGFFSFQGVDINEGTALGRNTRAIGDQSVAIGAQSVAGMGSIVIGGNDIQAYDQKKYFKAKNPDSGEAKGVNDYNAEVTPGTGKNGQPITITNKYKELVGVGLDRSWRASYGQDGSTVIGMQAHSTTPLGVAIGTNSIVRKGAFGATAIGSGASVVANAEAAVAIGMGSEARGNYAVAAGTAARAKESAVAFGYSSQADVNAVAVGNKSVSKGSAVAVGDESQAVEASVAVGQLAKAKKVADIAVGQGAVASGEQGAIAMGLGTQAQGDSSIMIGGSEITKVAAQTVNYQKEKKDAQGHTIIKSTKKTETIGGEQIERTIRSVEMENTSGTIQQAYGELTNGGTLNTTTLDYSSTTNKNGHGSISMGVHSLSTGDLGTAIGTGARVTKLGGVALGTGAISELQNGVAIGTGSRADMNSIGTRQTDISYDNEGKIVPFDSKKVAYTFYWAGGTNTSEGDVVSFGSPGAERQLKNVAAGRIADDSTDAINGSQLNSITKRMSNGWSVEAEKDKTSSGVLKLNGALATKGTEVHSADGKTTTRENPGTATGNIDKIRLSDEVKIRVGDNLVLHQEDASRPVYEDPDNPDRQTGTRVTSKFTYSLNPELTGLKSAQFKNDAGDTTDINGVGVTVTPVTAGKQPVSLTTTGLNNGGNVISDVAGNLPSTKNNDATTGSSNATTSQAAPMLGNAANQVNPTNAATVSDVLNAGWNLQGNNKAVDFVKPYDTVNFVNGDGTTATVESADGKTSTVKYSVNLGNGLKKDDATNKITVSAADKSLTVGTDGVKVNPGDKSLKTTNAGLTVNTADKSLEVTNDGLKVKTDGTTITTDKTNGLTVNTGTINNVATGDKAGTVEVKDGDKGKIATVDSVVNAVNSAAWIATSAKTTAGELGAEAKNQSVKAGDKVTFEADKNIKITQAGSKFTFATRDDVSFNTVQVGGSEGPKFAKAADSSIKVSDKDGTEPVKITNVKAGEISDTSTDAINGSQFHAVAKNTIKLAGQNGTGTATETDEQELDKKGGIKFTVKSNDGTLLDVAAKGDTITLTPKTATLTTGTDGVPTANTDGGKLVTADQLVTALKEMGWKATAGNEGTGTVTGNTEALIKAGNTVTFKAGDNLAVKQDGKNFIYSLQNELTGLTSAEFKNQAGDKTVINSDGVTITPATNGKQPVSLTKDGLNNGGNQITNVGGNLDGAKVGTDAPTTSHAPINSTDAAGPNYVNPNNAATVGDVLQAGWNLQGNSTAVDFVKPYDTVNFVDGDGTTVSVTNTDTKTSTVKYSINLGNGLEKDDTTKKVQMKPADKSLTVGADGVKVNTADQSLEVTDDGLKVKIDNKTITTGKDGLTVNTGTVNAVEQGDKKGTVEVPTADVGKIATVDTVAKAVNNAAFTLKASADGGTRNAGSGIGETGELIKAGSTIEMIAGKNLDVKHDASGKITFATVENPSFNTIQVGGDQGPKLSKTDDGNIKVSDKDSTNPVNITNVKSNLPDTKNSDAPNTATSPSNATKSQAAPTLGTSANQVNPANAATVGDVLNAGWNLQGNGSEVDFVKPYDTVNFVNGVNTTAVASTVDGKTSNVTYNVTGLPITYTDKDGNPVSKIGDKFYKVNDKGQPLDAKGNPSTKVNKDGKPVDDAGNVIDPINTTNNPVKTSLVNSAPEANKTGTTSPTTLDNVTSKLENYKADPVNGKEPAKNSLRDLTNKNVTDNTVATVGDIRNMGWIVSSDKTTGANGAGTADEYSEAVKNANEVRFVGEGSAIVSGKTEGNVRTITVKVDNQAGINKTVTPVNYTKADGTKVYPQEVDNGDGTKTVKFFENPDGSGAEVPKGDVVTSINGAEGTTSPTTLKNVKNNIPNVNDGSKTITNPDGTEKTGDVENINKASLTAEEAAELANPKTKDGQANPKYIGNNAATVSDVLNAGWNLQGNGVAKDFVKPFDTVNFVNGGNTTAVVSTSDDGTTSTVTYNVTGLPVTYTTADGTPVSKIGDKYYKVNDKGQPIDEQGNPSTKVNNNGEPLDENGVVIQPINTATNPLHSTLVNPNVTNTADAPNKQTTDPTQLGNVTSGLSKYGDTVDGKPVAGTTTANTGLIDLSKPTNGDAPKVSDNTAATVGDLRNMGWIVSSDKVTNDDGTATVKEYTEQVRNANEVKFVGKGTAIVSGKTVNGVRTITVKVDDQVSTNNAFMPTSFTTKDGTKVYPVKDDAGNVTYHTTPDGKGTLDNPDTVVNEGDVVTAVNGPKGTTTPTTVQNVKSNLPNVDDKKQKAFHPDGTEVTEPNSTTNAGNAKAPLSHTVVAAMMSPFMTNDEGDFIDENGNVTTDPKKYVRNPNFAANNAATVGDVLSAGWNLQNNGTAKDFVKPYDTVNFINGLGTTAVVTTREGNTTSDVSFNVKPANSSVTVDEDGVKVTTGEITPNTNGSVAGPTTPENAKTLKDALDAAVKELATAKDALKTAETALAANPKDPALQKAVEDKKADVAAKQTPVNEAQKAHDDAGLNKIATVQNVADTINNAGFNLKTSADGGEKLTTGTKNDGELIKPSNTVEMVAGKNLTVKQDANGKITYATKDNVTFTNVETGTLNVGSPNTYTDGKGNTYTKVGDKYYKPADVVNGAPKENATPVKIPADVVVKPVSPVTMKTEAAKPATNNAADAQPSSALNITAKDGKPTQITGVGSTLNTNVVTTTPEGTATKPGAAPDTKPKTEDAHLVDLNGTADAPINKNVAATVGDLQNMGWVVSAKDSNNYKDVVKNANVVDFKGSNGIEITGKTLADGTREITVGIKEGEVTNKVTITHADGKRTRALRVGNHFYKLDKDDRVASINKDEHGNLVGAPLHINPKEDTITNTGSGVVTGNTVANAIQASGWNIGLGSTNKDFSKETKAYDKVNPNDHVKFADGANANVSMVTVDGVNEDGIKEETTFIKVDVNRDLKIDSVTTGGTAVDKNGNNLVKVGDKYYKESDIDPVTKQLKETAKPVSPADVIPSKDGAMTVKDAKGNDGVSATAKDGKGTLTLKDAGKDGKDASQVDISTAKAPADLNDTPKDAVHANDGKWYAPADVDVKTENGNTVVTPKAGKSPIADAPTMDRIQYKGTDGKLRDVATMDDGLRFQGDDGESISKPLNSTVQLTGGNREDTGKPVAKDATTTGNIGVFNTDGKLSVQLAKDLDKLNSANFESKTDKAGNPLKAVDGKYYPENSVVKEGKVYPEGTVIIDNKPYPAGTTKDAAGKVVNNGKPATETTPINPIDSRQVQNGPTSKLTGTGLTFNTPTPKDEKGKPLVLVDGKYYKADNLENGKPKADAKPEPVKPAQSTAFTPDGLVVTPETAKVRDANGNPVLDKDGREVVDPTKVVAFGSPTIAVDPNTGKPMVDPKTGEPVMKSGISAGGQVMANVAPGVLDTDAVNVSQLKGVSNAVMNVNNRMNRMGAQAAALAGLQSIQYDPLEPTQISAGLGHYKGSSALALGVNYFKNESTMFHLGASLNGLGEETMMNASVTWKFGARADETAVKDTFRQGPISASYTLQDKVSALEAQTRVQKEQLKTIKGLEKQVELLKELNEKQQEQIAELFKRLSEK